MLRKITSSILRSRYFLLAMLLAVTSVIGIVSVPNSAHAAIGTITEYSLPYQPNFSPNNLGVGPDGKIWVTGFQRIAKLESSGSFTTYLRSATLGTAGITTGADGNLWFGEGTSIVNMTTSGTVLGQYSIPSGKSATNMTLGPDGEVWFTETVSAGTRIGKITTSGVITEYLAAGNDITAGPDGNLWFTVESSSAYSDKIGKITTSGAITYYTISTIYDAKPTSITAGPDGNLWFTAAGANKIVKITTSGVMTEYTLPSSPTHYYPYGITVGSDGAFWFTGLHNGKVGRMTTAGIVTGEYTVPGAGSGYLERIITGPDGAVWFLNKVARKIGRVATELTNQTISFTSTAPTSAIVDGPTYTPTASATSGLPVAITVDSSSASVCSIQGGVVSFQQAGTCTLNANQGGDADYNAAPQVQQSFTVAPVNADTSVALNCPVTALISATVTCTITIANNGPAAAKDVSLTALFSNSFSSTLLSGGGTLSGQSITWSTASLASGASTTLTFDATAALASRASFSTALLQTNPDPDISNNIVDAKIVIR